MPFRLGDGSTSEHARCDAARAPVSEWKAASPRGCEAVCDEPSVTPEWPWSL